MMTKQLNLIILIILFISATFFGCKKEDQTRLQANWSANDPILIPFNVRNNERNQGNLVKNPSFETGKVYYEKGNIKSFDIAGWKKVGNNIQWINDENEGFNSDEIYEGTHAIKIERSIADETEQTGEGIISDFIKVIPGNYSFKLYLRFENICPNQSRIGIKMYDAINLRLQFYDKNKIEISGTEYDAFRNKKIDNTFKSLTLSNYWQIEKFGWGEIFGKTANYPFFDGDIPDEARYVKIYIGLKGTGKMWVDNVDFRYTDKNFTMLERIKPFFDSSFLVQDLVFPQPKQLIKKQQIEFFNKELQLYPVIVIPENASKRLKECAQEIKNLLISCIKNTDNSLLPDIEIVNNVNQIKENQFVISVGNNELYNKYKMSLPDTALSAHKNAYYIFQSELKNNMVFINGSDDNAISDALKTFKQLFAQKASTYYAANIIDYPDISERAVLIHYFDRDLDVLNSKLELFTDYKFNDLYFEWYGSDNKEHYPFNSMEDLQNTNNAGNYSLLVDFVKLNAKQTIKGNSNESYNYSSLLSKACKSILFVGDSYQPYEECNQEKVVFQSSTNINKNIQFDHINLLNDINNRLNGKNSLTKLEFLAPWNSLYIIDKGQGRAEMYFTDLNRNIPEDITMYWTGGAFYTESIDFAEYYRINEITGHNPALFDNSLLAYSRRLNTDYLKNYYAGKIRTLSIFEPYNMNIFNAYYNSNERKTVLNTNHISELNTIRILTASNYYWNAKSYNPEKSLWIVLNKLFGRELAIKLIYFNDSYYGLKEICQKMEVDGSQYKNLRIAKNFETELIKNYEELKISLNNKALLLELENLKAELLLKYNDLAEVNK